MSVSHSAVIPPLYKCQVCKAEVFTWRALSPYSGMQIDYCERCLVDTAEPLWILAAFENLYNVWPKSYYNGKYISYDEAIGIIGSLGDL